MVKMVITGIEFVGGEDAVTKALMSAMRESEKFKPFDIVIDSDHASYVEYGTGPANSGSHEADVFGQSAKDKIMRWAQTKPSFAGLTPRQRKDLGYATYNKVMKMGIPPTPFIRPALDEFFTSENLTEFFSNENGTMERMAQHLASRMQDILLENDTYYTWDLYDHIFVRPRDAIGEASIAEEQQAEQNEKYSNVEKKGGRRK